MSLKLWLDDVRHPPPLWEDFFCAKTAPAAIQALEGMSFDEVSLDHDLGEDLGAGDGYDVLLYIEERVRTRGWSPPTIRVHSANPVARQRMERAIQSILTYQEGVL